MTNRELVQKAMPLRSLSRNEWKAILNHAERTKFTDKEIFHTINIILENQARLEILSNYHDYYFDKLEEEIPESSSVIVL